MAPRIYDKTAVRVLKADRNWVLSPTLPYVNSVTLGKLFNLVSLDFLIYQEQQ